MFVKKSYYGNMLVVTIQHPSYIFSVIVAIIAAIIQTVYRTPYPDHQLLFTVAVVIACIGVLLRSGISMSITSAPPTLPTDENAWVEHRIREIIAPPIDPNNYDNWDFVRNDPDIYAEVYPALRNHVLAEKYFLSHREEFEPDDWVVFMDNRVLRKQKTDESLSDDIPSGAWCGYIYDFDPNTEAHTQMNAVDARFTHLAAKVKVDIGTGTSITPHLMKIDTGADQSMIHKSYFRYMGHGSARSRIISSATSRKTRMMTIKTVIGLDGKETAVDALVGEKWLLGMDVMQHYLHDWERIQTCTIQQ